MIGVVVPANNEEAAIGRCLDALTMAARHASLDGEEVRVLVVLDCCDDHTENIVRARGIGCLQGEMHNVGAARALGARALIDAGARWLAFTDADSEVAPDWIARQLEARAEAVCGVVAVADWSEHSAETRAEYESRYTDAEGHRHIHGASLGVATHAYLKAGGFSPLRCSEDVALVQQLSAIGADIRWTNSVRVHTSARRVARAPHGFAAFVSGLPGSALQVSPPSICTASFTSLAS